MTDLEKLKAAAEAATPGPWTVDGPPDNQIVWSGPEHRVCFLAHSNGRDENRDLATGQFIALANPATVLALLSRLASAEKALKEIIAEDDTGPTIYETDENGRSWAVSGSEGKFAAAARAHFQQEQTDHE